MADPKLARAFDQLADVFAPPSGQEFAGYARGRAMNEDAARKAAVWALRTGDPAALDLAAQAAGLYPFAQGREAVTIKDTTNRRGQDIESGDRRYGVDVGASTARRGQDLDRRTKLDTTMLAPVGVGATRFVPPNLADMYDVGPTQTGVVELQPGEKSVLPDGRTLEGAPKPLTETEVKAKIIEGLTPEEQRAVGFGSTPVVETGKGPMTNPQRLATGTPELSDKQPQTFNSASGPVRWDAASQRYVSVQTGQPVDVSGGLQAPSAAQGKEGALGPTPTTSNRTAANQRAAQLDSLQLLTNEFAKTLQTNPGIVGPVGDIRGFAQNLSSVISDMTQAFGGDPNSNVEITAEQVKQVADRIAPSRDPNIQRARIMMIDLAYQWAQAQSPDGRVGQREFDIALKRLSGGSLPNNAAVLETLGAVNEFVARQRAANQRLINPGQADVQPGAAAPAGPRTVQTPAGTVTIEPVQ